MLNNIINLAICSTACYNKTSKLCITERLWGELIGDSWIPRTKGQYYRKRPQELLSVHIRNSRHSSVSILIHIKHAND